MKLKQINEAGTPTSYAQEAAALEKKGDIKGAIKAWKNAKKASTGHNRRARYQEHIDRLEKKK